MQISIGTCFDFDIPIREQLPLIMAAGFTHISLGAGVMSHSAYLEEEGREQLKKLTAATGLRICSVHAPFNKACDVSSPDPEVAAAAVAVLKQCIDAAESLDAPVVIFHPAADGPPDVEARKPVFIKNVKLLLDYVGGRPVKLAAENLYPWINEITAASFDEIAHPKYGFCYDSSHDNLSGAPLAILDKYGERLMATHISDNMGREDDHILPFDGKFDWERFYGAFPKNSFSGVFLLEVEREKYKAKPVQWFLEQAFERGAKIMQKLNYL